MKPRVGLRKRDLAILLLLVLAVISVVAYRYWQRSRAPRNPLDFGGLPGVIVFSSSTCAPCITQKEILDELAPRYEDRARLVRLDVYEYLELARQFRVEYIPTLVFFDRDGRAVEIRAGLMDAATLEGRLQRLLGGS
jgi:thioredoxin 1